jgi:hypothetical protein
MQKRILTVIYPFYLYVHCLLTKQPEIFAPLTTAAALPDHPSMSQPYKTTHLTDMTEEAGRLARKERANLWTAKRIMAKMRGDVTWAPCGFIETNFDTNYFGQARTDSVLNHSDNAEAQPMKRTSTTTSGSSKGDEGISTTPQTSVPQVENGDVTAPSKDAEMLGRHRLKTNDGDLANPDPQSNVDGDADGVAVASFEPPADPRNEHEGGAVQPVEADGIIIGHNENDDQASETGSQPQVHRMTTRARANNQSKTATPRESPPLNESNRIHPFFEFDISNLPDLDFGLPAAEAEDTRNCLLAFIQKHEEIARSSDELHQEMLKADKMRMEIWRACKAEAHMGEMSDGEDWYDREEWGLEEDLRKGKDEDEEPPDISTKKTRQRRNREDR